MPDQFIERSSQSWISRLGGSLKSVLFGIVLFGASIVLLWWNEGRAVKTAKGLKEGSAAVVRPDDFRNCRRVVLGLFALIVGNLFVG